MTIMPHNAGPTQSPNRNRKTKPKVKRIVVPGTFDPITLGHIDIIERASRLADEVIVAVAASREKRGTGPLFSIEERVELAQKSLEHLSGISVKPFTGLLVSFCENEDAFAVVKGLRAITDFEWEFQQASLNWRIDPTLECIFIMSSPIYNYLSSSVVREVAMLGGDVSKFVLPHVQEALCKKLQ